MTPAEFCAGSPLYDVAEQRIFDRLTPATPSDYLALRRLEVSVPTARDGDIGLVTMAERGTLCGGASDGAACKKSYGRLESDAPWSPLVFFTRGDKVGIVRSHGGAMTLLGTIDSPEEAFYVAQLGGFRFTCTGDNAAGYRAVDGGFEIVTQAGGCGKPIERIVVRVYADGSLEEISRVTTEAETRACPQP